MIRSYLSYLSSLFHLFLIILPYVLFGMSIMAAVIGDRLLQAVLILCGVLALFFDVQGQRSLMKFARGKNV